MSRTQRKSKIWQIVITVGLVLLTLMTIGIATKVFDSEVKNVNPYFGYNLGSIDLNGKVCDSKQNIVQKDLQTVEGLEIEVSEDSTITYKVAFYGENDELVLLTDSLNEDLDLSIIPEAAKTFRVVITPNAVDGEIVEISSVMISKYSKMLTVKYNS